jgi:hypothetical protein
MSLFLKPNWLRGFGSRWASFNVAPQPPPPSQKDAGDVTVSSTTTQAKHAIPDPMPGGGVKRQVVYPRDASRKLPAEMPQYVRDTLEGWIAFVRSA